MAIHHAKAVHEHDREWWAENRPDADPIEPFDYNPQAKKYCKTCRSSNQPEKVWQSHHTGQIFACPSIPINSKRDLIKRYKKEEIREEWSDADA